MTYALGYLGMAAITGGLAWHHLDQRRRSNRLVTACTLAVVSVLWPVFWAMAAFWFVRAFRR